MIIVHQHLYRRSLFIEPRCNTFIAVALTATGVFGTATAATLGTAAAIGGAAGSVGLGAASAAGAFSSTPSYPNTSADSAAMANAQAEQLPEMQAMEAAAQEGGTTLNPGYTSAGSSDAYRAGLQQQIAAIQAQLTPAPVTHQIRRNGQRVPSTPPTPINAPQLQKQLAALQSQLAAVPAGSTIYKDSKGNLVPASQAMTNFAGNSTADIQGKIQEQLAQGELTNAQQYDSQFIAQALAEEQQANPQGVAASGELAALVQQQINNPPQSPVAQTMQDQVQAKVAAGSGLTPEEQAMLDASVNSSVTGTTGNTPNFGNALTTGFAGEQRALQNAGSGATWLASGQTPEDITYRANQQNLSNLSAEISGATPESQFSELSGAQSGPTPNTSTNYLPSYNTGAAAQGAQAGLDQYGQQVGQALNTANPWTSGLSAVTSAAGALNKAGVL